MKINFNIDKNEALRYRGHRGGDIPPNLDKVADEVLGKIEAHITPRFVHSRFAVKQVENGVMLDNGLVLQGEDIKKHLAGCDECYIICATVGIGADNFIRTMSVMGSVYALMADGAATAAVEAVCDSVEDFLRQELKKEKLYLTWRYSPGYGDFPFTQQPDILSLLNADKLIGVSCNASCMMTPAKSVTAVMGIAKAKPRAKTRSCDRCPNKENCNFSCR